MTQKEILEYNKRCSEFHYPNAKAEYESGDISIEECIFKKGMLIFGHFDLMKYHSDWNWIMEVVEAIEDKDIDDYPFILTMTVHNVFIENPMVIPNAYIVQAVIEDSKKEAVVKAINQFLIWYNENKSNN